MSFYQSQNKDHIKRYREYLQIVGSLSNLFSDSNIPYLYYRIAEKMFCKAFNAEDLSRGDVSYDAKKDLMGIGLKTFLRGNDKTIQKIAEFNKDSYLYKNLSIKEKIKTIAKLRNKRLEFTNNLYDISNSMYHCVIRDKGKFYIYEEDTKFIDVEKIKNIKESKSSVYFNDDQYEYSFSLSKSTLMKRFKVDGFVDEFDVNILSDPLEELYTLVESSNLSLSGKYLDTAFLPLYGEGGKVYESSGLNQWNAKGRVRNSDEVYIPIPKVFYQNKPNFFPNKDKIFNLKLPNNKVIQAKVCQENGKALMSNPNKDLGNWLLRDVLKLEEDTLVTNEILDIYGVDSVRLDKLDENNYEINFSHKGSFEEFMLNYE